MTTRARQTLGLFLSAALLPVFALVLPHLPRRESSSTTVVSNAVQKKRPRIALVTNNNSDYWTVARKGAEYAASAAAVDLEFMTPASGTASEQVQIVNDLLASGVDSIAVAPVNSAMQATMLDQATRKTLLFTLYSDAPQSKRACFVGSDNISAGRVAGRELKSALPQGGSIAVFVGTTDSPDARDRLAGLRRSIEGSKIRIVAVLSDNTDRMRAKSNVSEVLQQHPRISGLVGLWSYNGPAILSALRDAKKLRKVKVVCFDEEDDTLDGVQSGTVSATIVQHPYRQAEETVRVMAQVLAGNRKAIPLSRYIPIRTFAVSRRNLDGYRSHLNKMRAR